MAADDILSIVMPGDTLVALRDWVRGERQRAMLTQGELAAKSNVPATTISRLERTGLASTDSLVRVLFALDALNPVQDFLRERLRLASFPRTLHEERKERKILRVRHPKGVHK